MHVYKWQIFCLFCWHKKSYLFLIYLTSQNNTLRPPFHTPPHQKNNIFYGTCIYTFVQHMYTSMYILKRNKMNVESEIPKKYIFILNEKKYEKWWCNFVYFDATCSSCKIFPQHPVCFLCNSFQWYNISVTVSTQSDYKMQTNQTYFQKNSAAEWKGNLKHKIAKLK